MRTFNVLMTLIKRELQENKLGLIYAPWTVSLILGIDDCFGLFWRGGYPDKQF